jgi:hypothetical protein
LSCKYTNAGDTRRHSSGDSALGVCRNRIPGAVLRLQVGHHEAPLHTLNGLAHQWDSLFW